MIDIGRVCLKVRGREAGRYCVVVDIIDEKFVIVDGDVRRRRVNIRHLEPTPIVLNIKRGESTENVVLKMIENKIPVSYWKLKRDKCLIEPIISAYKKNFGENWEEIAKKVGSPGKSR